MNIEMQLTDSELYMLETWAVIMFGPGPDKQDKTKHVKAAKKLANKIVRAIHGGKCKLSYKDVNKTTEDERVARVVSLVDSIAICRKADVK
jgi:hypothetical protein